jgi:hypothetical protein
MLAFAQHFEHAAGQAILALARLVGVGIDAERDRLGHVRRVCQFTAQQFRRVDLGEQPGFEVEPWRQAEIAVGGPGKTVNAAGSYMKRLCSQV